MNGVVPGGCPLPLSSGGENDPAHGECAMMENNGNEWIYIFFK